MSKTTQGSDSDKALVAAQDDAQLAQTLFSDDYEDDLDSDEYHEARPFRMFLDIDTDNDKVFEAESVLSPHGSATMAIAKVQQRVMDVPEDLTAIAMLLKQQSKSKGTGEEILNMQATTLNLTFNHLLGRAMEQEDFDVSEKLIRLAYKAQALSRANFTAISDIRHPRITNHIAQMNNAAGHQQVNNSASTRTGETAESKIDKKNTPNKLSDGVGDDLS